MKHWVSLIILVTGLTGLAGLTGCQRYEPAPEMGQKTMVGDSKEDGLPDTHGQEISGGKDQTEGEADIEAGNSDNQFAKAETQEIVIDTKPERTPVKVKGVYVSAYVAGMEDLMDEIIAQIDRTELNAVVIDVKDDHGRVTFAMDSPSAQAIGACVNYIPDMQALAAKLKEHNIYMIARIPAFRDPYLAEARPDWCCKLADGQVFRDRNKLAWVNPYKKEVWNYLVEIGKMAGEAGFDEIQFDYIRFCTEKGMQKVVFSEEDTQGKSRQEIILEFVQYAYDQLAQEGLFVSADVFGVVMSQGVDANAVGQDYGQMAASLDYICPMIYPSHYSDGYFGIDHPDTQPYLTIASALAQSKQALAWAEENDAKKTEAAVLGSEAAILETEVNTPGSEAAILETEANTPGSEVTILESEANIPGSEVTILEDRTAGQQEGSAVPEKDNRRTGQAIVRPWLQDFTASYLKHHIPYGAQQVREQIQAVYDSGYEEWILWDAKVTYHYDGLLPE